ncbi:MAG: hypothetical protein JWP22_2623 [Ramlibacter sp.]|nr:hypothetical protein [Ramlibacter sp.]
MPSSFEVRTSTGSYNVQVGRGLVGELLARQPDAIVMVDERLRDRLPANLPRVISLPANEEQKSLEKMAGVILALRGLKAGRDTHVVVIGGGILQDIGTFVCSVYMRGIAWSYMPTTMLGMADSCIGGKSSINVGGLKNLVGNIYPPREVVVDTDFISTLDAGQTVGGLVEAVKICFARGYDAFCTFDAEQARYPLSAEHAERLMLQSLTVKRWFIEVDEFDKKERLLLNYGHTFGHAVEAATNFGIAHGLAVGMGVIAANAAARDAGWLSPKGLEIADHRRRHMIGLVRSANLQPDAAIPLAKVLDKFESDKKHRKDGYRIVAPQGDGALALVSLPRNRESLDRIAAGIAEACQALDWPLAA